MAIQDIHENIQCGSYERVFFKPDIMKSIDITKIIAAVFFSASAAKFEIRNCLK